MGDKKGLGLAAALASKGEEKKESEPDFDKMFDDACDELMAASDKKDPKRFKRALRAALKTARDS